MAEDARAAAGSVSVSPAAGGGTSVVLTMPYVCWEA
jgi:hypothetical protein